MNAFKAPITCFLLLYSMMAFSEGDQSMYCPKGATYISPGMNIMSVKEACGTPVSATTTKKPATKKASILQWTFRIRASHYQPGQLPIIRHSNAKFTAGGLDQPTLIVTFENDKVVDVNVNGQSMPQSTMCDGNSVQVGDNTSAVENACGPPFYTNRSFREVPTGQEVKVEVWTVKVGPYQSTATLTFENGVLKSIAQ